jgi:hypothetical protein
MLRDDVRRCGARRTVRRLCRRDRGRSDRSSHRHEGRHLARRRRICPRHLQPQGFHPPLEGGSKLSLSDSEKRISGRGIVEAAPRPEKFFASLRIFRPALKGRVTSRRPTRSRSLWCAMAAPTKFPAQKSSSIWRYRDFPARVARSMPVRGRSAKCCWKPRQAPALACWFSAVAVTAACASSFRVA